MKLLVMLQNGKRSETFTVKVLDGRCGLAAVESRVVSWLAAAVEHAKASGVCMSFVVSVHHMTAECNHEVDHGNTG